MNTINTDTWPPSFTLDQERILKLLTGDRFYTNPSAALREAILNAIDAVHRRKNISASHASEINVTFNRDDLTFTVSDNGIGMNSNAISDLFTKVGASAANDEAKKNSVGEFGIGVISYFMAGDAFTLQTYDGQNDPIGLSFSNSMLAGGNAKEITTTQISQGTTVAIQIRNSEIFNLLLENFSHWCRDVEGLSCKVMPENSKLSQGGTNRSDNFVKLEHPVWVERAHLVPVADMPGWNAMTGISTVDVLYRGVFVQKFEVKGAWGIEGSIDVDPKHFQPRLNREGFIEGQFQSEVETFLKTSHPTILEEMANNLAAAMESGLLDKWTQKQWAGLWLSVPRTGPYKSAVKAWDNIFRKLPAFERAMGNNWVAISLEDMKTLEGEMYLAPLPDEKSNDVVKAALHFLRNTRRNVIRGIKKENSWLRFAPLTYATTADLITHVFSSELPPLVSLNTTVAEKILEEIPSTAPLYTSSPLVDLVNLGKDSPPVLRLKHRLVINTDHPVGNAIAKDALNENNGQISLIAIAARHAYEQLSEVAAAVRNASVEPEVLSPIRRRFLRRYLP